jgi:hypothetical protein
VVVCVSQVLEAQLSTKKGVDFKVSKAEDKVLMMRNGVGCTLTAVSSFGLTPLPLVHLMSALVKIVSFKKPSSKIVSVMAPSSKIVRVRLGSCGGCAGLDALNLCSVNSLFFSQT